MSCDMLAARSQVRGRSSLRRRRVTPWARRRCGSTATRSVWWCLTDVLALFLHRFVVCSASGHEASRGLPRFCAVWRFRFRGAGAIAGRCGRPSEQTAEVPELMMFSALFHTPNAEHASSTAWCCCAAFNCCMCNMAASLPASRIEARCTAESELPYSQYGLVLCGGHGPMAGTHAAWWDLPGLSATMYPN